MLQHKDNPWKNVVTSLQAKPKADPMPRKLSVWQLYMRKKGDEINTVFQERWPLSDRPSKDALAFRAEIAREMIAGESEEYLQQLEEECQTLHAEDLEAHENGELTDADDSDGGPDADSIAQFVNLVLL